MQPKVVLLADVSDLVDGVECPIHCGPSRGVHKEWMMTLKGHARQLDGTMHIE